MIIPSIKMLFKSFFFFFYNNSVLEYLSYMVQNKCPSKMFIFLFPASVEVLLMNRGLNH